MLRKRLRCQFPVVRLGRLLDRVIPLNRGMAMAQFLLKPVLFAILSRIGRK